MLRKSLLLAVVGAMLVVQSVRVQLVAKEPAWTMESAKAKIEELDARLAALTARVEEFKTEAEALKTDVAGRLEEAKALAADPSNLSAETRRSIDAVQFADEARQLQAIGNVKALGEQAVLVLAYAAEQSLHEAVRRAALTAAIEMGRPGYPALAYAYKSLPVADRKFVVEKLAGDLSRDHLIGLAAIAGTDPDKEVRQAALDAGLKSPDRAPLIALWAKEADESAVVELIRSSGEMEGDDVVVLLYAAASKGQPAMRVAAVEGAVERGDEAIVVLAPAWKSQEPVVRTAVVRAAKKFGGQIGQFLITRALADPNDELRQAAEAALAEPE